MNTCTLNANIKPLILKYVNLLIKSENIHYKLEKLYLETYKSNFIKQQILKLNNKLNNILVTIMKLQWLIEIYYF